MKTIILDNIKDLQISYEDDLNSAIIYRDNQEWNNVVDTGYSNTACIIDLENRVSHIEADFFGENIRNRLENIEEQDIYSISHELNEFHDAILQLKVNCNEFRENIELLRSQLDALSEAQKQKPHSKIFDPISTDLDFPIKIDELDFDYETFIEKLYNL